MPLPHLKLTVQATQAPRTVVLEDSETTPEPWRLMRGQPPGDSNDLRRIVALPRRPRPDDATLQRWADAWKKVLGKNIGQPCQCVSRFNRRCCANLLPTQAWALTEAAENQGLLGPIGVGHGKTLLDMLTPMVVESKRAILLLPPPLKLQFLQTDWHFYGQHWQLPNLAGTGRATEYEAGKPFLYVMSFAELSSAKNTEVLDKLQADTIIVDEGHNLRNKNAARTKRFLRYLQKAVNLYVWSGTLTSKSIKDYAHLSEYALGDGSPVPLFWPTVEEWSTHLDPIDVRTPVGSLWKLGGEDTVRLGLTDAKPLFQRRLTETPGVVTSGDSASCNASLLISERPLVVPTVVLQALSKFDESARKEAWQRPDGEEIVDALTAARTARELSCGFYYRWRWSGEKQSVIEKWLEARKNWHRELREKLKRGGPHMDSPLLVTQAAIRWHEGYVHIERDEEGNELRRVAVKPYTRNGPRPTWDSECWLPWKEVRGTASPATEAVWLSDFMLEDVLKWLAEGPGLAWYEFGSFAQRLVTMAREQRIPVSFAGPGKEGNQLVDALTGKEAVLASIRAHGTGKNLQAFCRNLVANPPSDGATWEQLLGRTHRAGQMQDEVTFEVYRHSEAMRNAVERARDLSAHIEGTFGVTQRLASVATWGF